MYHYENCTIVRIYKKMSENKCITCSSLKLFANFFKIIISFDYLSHENEPGCIILSWSSVSWMSTNNHFLYRQQWGIMR